MSDLERDGFLGLGATRGLGSANNISPFRLPNRCAENRENHIECVYKFHHIINIWSSDETSSPSLQLHARTAIHPEIPFMNLEGDDVPDRSCRARLGLAAHALPSPGRRESDLTASLYRREPGRGCPPDERYRYAATTLGGVWFRAMRLLAMIDQGLHKQCGILLAFACGCAELAFDTLDSRPLLIDRAGTKPRLAPSLHRVCATLPEWKQRRQVVMVTGHANPVVNADADQIIENPDLRKAVNLSGSYSPPLTARSFIYVDAPTGDAGRPRGTLGMHSARLKRSRGRLTSSWKS